MQFQKILHDKTTALMLSVHLKREKIRYTNLVVYKPVSWYYINHSFVKENFCHKKNISLKILKKLITIRYGHDKVFGSIKTMK